MEPLVTLDEIRAARERIKNAARFTPLIEVAWPGKSAASSPPAFAKATAGKQALKPSSLYVKCENFQPMGAFKIRGAFNMIAQLSKDALERGVITYSSGNHGQAVALAAKMLGAPAVIVMPTTAPAVKVEGCKSYGAQVIMEGTTSLHRQARAEKEAAERGLTIVPPFDHRMIIAGQGTTGLEILEQCPDVGTVFVPVGGGGLASGVGAAIKLSKPSVRVIAVEPQGAPKMSKSLAAGHPITLESSASIADGLMNLRPGNLTFAHIQKFVDEVVTVSEQDIADTVGWLFRNARLVVEPSGAVTTAAVALGLGNADLSKGPIVAIITGGNVAPEAFAKYIGV
ncbi:MAG: threonine/serine dehydratase [Acidobacteriota bacterium]|nr:threonine/serine dehydratase [Acidobacteriota bacterium]